MSFISENTPLPIVNSVNNSSKESAILRYYRSISNLTGYLITVNSSTNQTLPIDAYNMTKSTLGLITFKNGNTAIIGKTASFVHNIYVNIYSTSPSVGLLAMDIINKNNNSLSPDAITTKNVTPNSSEILVLTSVHQHTIGDEVRLRWGGGLLPGGGDLDLNILSVMWTIIEE